MIKKLTQTIPALPLIAFLVSGLLILCTFHHGLIHLTNEWQKDEYSHGFLLPLLSILMGLHILAKKPQEYKPSWSGVGLLLFSFAIALFGTHGAARHFVLLGVWFSLIALTLTYLGTKATKLLAPAFIYLLFSFPAPTELYNNASLELQLLSSHLGAMALNLLGISVFQNGNIIDLGTYQLQVVEACNGLRYLFPLMSFGYLMAYLLKDSWWKRIVLFLSTIPIAIAMNVFRIAGAGIAVNYWGPEMAEGLVHDLQGWVVFSICIFVLMIEVWALLRIGQRGTLDLDLFTLPQGPFGKGQMKFGAHGLLFLLLILGSIPYALGGGFGGKKPNEPAYGSLSTFPIKIGPWEGRRLYLDSATLKVLKLSDYTQITYTNPKEKASVNLYVAYLAKQTTGIIIHPPTNCLPGSGWEIKERSEVTLASTKIEGEPLKLVRLLIQSGGNKQIVYFWYEQQGEKVTSQLQGRFRLMLNSFLHNRTDGALTRIITPLLPNETEAEADKRALRLLETVLPVINTSLPQQGQIQ